MNRTGWGFVVGGVGLYVLGTWLGYAELNVLGAAALLLVAGALATVARPVTLTGERRLTPQRVTAGELAEGHLVVTNHGARRSPSVLGIEQLSVGGGVELAVAGLRPRRSRTLVYPLPTERRAVVAVGPFVVSRSDPFGFVERRSRHGRADTLWVHPRVHPIGPLPVGRQRDVDGATEDAAAGEMVFHSLRDYVVGDDLRRVHWKATAHRGVLMVREHVDPAQPDATVVLDDRDDVLDAAGFDLAVEVVASVAIAARHDRFPLRLLSLSGAVQLPPATDDVGLLDALAAVERRPLGNGDGPAAVARQVTASGGGRALVVVTGRAGVRDLPTWSTVGRRFGVAIVVVVHDPDDPVAPAAPGGLTVLPVTTAADFVAAWRRLR